MALDSPLLKGSGKEMAKDPTKYPGSVYYARREKPCDPCRAGKFACFSTHTRYSACNRCRSKNMGCFHNGDKYVCKFFPSG